MDRILAAAQIKAQYPISYADAFAVALAQELNAAIVTGDSEFKQVESIVKLSWL
jgi:ribonuclease VapC